MTLQSILSAHAGPKLSVMLYLLERCPHVLTSTTSERRSPEDVAAEIAQWADAIIAQCDDLERRGDWIEVEQP